MTSLSHNLYVRVGSILKNLRSISKGEKKRGEHNPGEKKKGRRQSLSPTSVLRQRKSNNNLTDKDVIRGKSH